MGQSYLRLPPCDLLSSDIVNRRDGKGVPSSFYIWPSSQNGVKKSLSPTHFPSNRNSALNVSANSPVVTHHSF